ncbi:MAG: alpha-beta hydrolase superfamily lysophospholipase [Planctomycetota bacterium]|jgi:alpha-beta hydrolase superfamily lysophospholipase
MCEAYESTRSPAIRELAEKAVRFIERARNPYAAWRYDNPPIEKNDTSVTAWMIQALFAARRAGISIDIEAYHRAAN